jgi:FkbM family methyltransferase
MITSLAWLPGEVKKYYYRAKLTLWAWFYLPKILYVADSEVAIPARCWQVAIPCRIDTTQILYEGRKRDRGRMFYEPVEAPYFKELLIGRKTFFDVGANIGYYSYLAAAAGVKRIVAFEFMREYAKFTSEAFKLNHVPGEVINRGVGKPGEETSYSDPLAGVSGPTLSLDEYARENNVYPDIIKMDIEGYELDALRNAHEILVRKPVIDISIHSSFLVGRGQSAEDVLNLLEKYGYRTIWSGDDTYFMRAE